MSATPFSQWVASVEPMSFIQLQVQPMSCANRSPLVQPISCSQQKAQIRRYHRERLTLYLLKLLAYKIYCTITRRVNSVRPHTLFSPLLVMYKPTLSNKFSKVQRNPPNKLLRFGVTTLVSVFIASLLALLSVYSEVSMFEHVGVL